MSKIVIVSKGRMSRQHPEVSLAGICLQLTGGGYTVAQTQNAMILQDQIRTTGKAKIKGFTITLEEEAA